MRICILGNTRGSLDEGMNKVTSKICKELSKRNKVLVLNPRDIFTFAFWNRLKSFNPQIIHYIPGPTIRSLIVLKMTKLYLKNIKIISSSTRPCFSDLSKILIKYIKPDLLLSQSIKFEEFFQKYGYKTSFFLNGVDVETFCPISKDEKALLRQELGVPKDEFVILHVGHINRNRNLQVLAEVQRLGEVQVIVVGSTFMPIDSQVKDLLEKSGCLVWRRYFKNIEELYKMADCYVFPTRDIANAKLPKSSGSIDFPLSVLEAMACNLPVVTTRFGALTRIFKSGDGFFYFDGHADLLQKLKLIKRGGPIKTAEKVKRLSWSKVVKELEWEYQKLIV